MDVRKVGAVLGVVGALAFGSSRSANAQSGVVAFAPTIGTVPDGVNLSVTPVVSADRRYVRLTNLNPTFIDFDRFDTFTIPAAVSGGGNGGLGGFGGGLGGGGGGGGLGLRNVGMGPNAGALSGFADSQPLASFVVADPDAPVLRAKAAKGRTASRAKSAKKRDR